MSQNQKRIGELMGVKHLRISKILADMPKEYSNTSCSKPVSKEEIISHVLAGNTRQERKKIIIKLATEDHLTQKRIGELMGLSRSRIAHILEDVRNAHANTPSSTSVSDAEIVNHGKS